MKSKWQITFILMLAVAAQAPFIDGYVSLPLPPANPVEWFSQGQLLPSDFYAYVVQPSSYYRDATADPIHSWAYNNPIVRMDAANAIQTGAAMDTKSSIGLVRTKRQILLRYRGSARRGRSLNGRSLSKDSAALLSTATREGRQIPLRQRSSGLSSFQPEQLNATPVRSKRQILLRYRNAARRRTGRSLNGPSLTGAMSTY